jgi:hypothetical protein
MNSLRHLSDGSRRRHAIIAAGFLLIPPAPITAAPGVLVPEHGGIGDRPRHQRRGTGLAANLNFGASTGALRREIDHYSCQALGLSHGHFDSPFGLHVVFNAEKRSVGAIAHAEKSFAFGANYD